MVQKIFELESKVITFEDQIASSGTGREQCARQYEDKEKETDDTVSKNFQPKNMIGCTTLPVYVLLL